MGRLLGKGAFGKVNLGMHKLTGKLVALKSIKKEFLGDEESKRKMMQEFAILRQLRHRNVIRLYETFESQKHIVFVIELCPGGDLLTYVRKRRRLNEDVARHVFRQLLDGLSYCHSKQVLHRDIKLDNALLSADGELKLCDFGVSKQVRKDELMREQCGTPAYIAPEILRGKGYLGFEVDVWSAGVVLYAMLHGSVPFNAPDMHDLHKLILTGKFKLRTDISHEARDLLRKMLELDPTKRITTEQIGAHDWLAKSPSTSDHTELFSAEEKAAIGKEYAYPGKRREEDAESQFTERDIDASQSELMRNNSTKSVILAPFNSLVEKEESVLQAEGKGADVREKRKAIKFAPRAKEVDRQYEKNNNGDMDNGVYNKCASSTTNNNLSEHQSLHSSHSKKETPLKAAEQPSELYLSIISRDDSCDFSPESKTGHSRRQLVVEPRNTGSTLAGNTGVEEIGIRAFRHRADIDEEIVKKVETFGYPKGYLVNALAVHELNHATTCYYLLSGNK